jgi:hypothetical protein
MASKQKEVWDIRAILTGIVIIVVLGAVLVLITGTKLSSTGNVVAQMCYDSDNTPMNTLDSLEESRRDSFMIKGIVMNCGALCKDVYTDRCIGNMLQEFYCDNNDIKAVAYTCPNGCYDGQCR